jgi:hypothetical protein
MVRDEKALCVPGNHDAKLYKYLSGRNVTISHGLAETIEQLETETAEFKAMSPNLLTASSAICLRRRKLVVAHAGLKRIYKVAVRARSGISRFMERLPAKPMSSGCLSGNNWQLIIEGEQASF